MTRIQEPQSVLFLHNSSQISGGERSLLNLFEHLDRNRFKPFLVLPQMGELAEEAQKLDVEVVYLAVPKISLVNLKALIQASRALQKVVDQRQVRIIHSYAPRNNLLGWWVARRKGLAIIWHERNIPLSGEPDITRLLLGWPDRVICNSQAVAQRFATPAGLADHIRVILNGIRLDYFKPQERREGPPSVGMVANLNKRKGIEFFLEVAAQIARLNPEIRWFVIGGEFPDCGGQRLAELKKLAHNYGLGERMTLTGYQADVRPWLHHLDVFVHVTEQEACSRAILEAMACGKAVVAARDGGNPELIDHGINGELIEPGAKAAWIAAITDLVGDVEKRRCLGAQARRKAEVEFDVERNARQTQAVYEELLAKSRPYHA